MVFRNMLAFVCERERKRDQATGLFRRAFVSQGISGRALDKVLRSHVSDRGRVEILGGKVG